MGIDDELDDLLDTDFDLEAAFRDLSAQADLEELKRRRPRPESRARTSSRSRSTSQGNAARERASRRSSSKAKAGADPLKDLKSALDGDAPAARRYVVVVCPSCSAKNRVPLERLRAELPVCGRCKTDLSFLG